MFITKKNRLAVYAYLFKEGTLVVKKDGFRAVHSEEISIPNLEVMKLMQSLTSRALVTETFNWQYYYYYLTPEGVDYLRKYLGLPEDIVPQTHKKPAVEPKSYSRYPRTEKKFVGGDYKPNFRGERGERTGGERTGGERGERSGRPAYRKSEAN